MSILISRHRGLLRNFMFLAVAFQVLCLLFDGTHLPSVTYVLAATSTDIPNITNKTTYYELLKVDVNAPIESIKRSYRKIALLHHPDKAKAKAPEGQTPEQKEAQGVYFVKVSHAYEIVSDAKTRTRYDYMLSRGSTEYDEKFTDWDEFDKVRGGKYTMTTTTMPDGSTKYFFKDAFALKEDQSADIALIVSGLLLLACIVIPTYFHFQNKREERIREAEEKAEKDRKNAARKEKIRLSMLKSQNEQTAREQEKEQMRTEQRERNVKKIKAAKSALVEEKSVEDVKSSSLFSCGTCKKTYKTANQLAQHFESREHEKAEKALERANQARAKATEKTSKKY